MTHPHKRYLSWQVIDQNGKLTAAFITTTLLRYYLIKRLLPYINKNYKKGIFFVNGHRICHYSSMMTEWLGSNGFKFVEKFDNAPDVAVARPIETFWAVRKREYAQRAKPAAPSLKRFKLIWTEFSSKIAL